MKGFTLHDTPERGRVMRFALSAAIATVCWLDSGATSTVSTVTNKFRMRPVFIILLLLALVLLLGASLLAQTYPIKVSSNGRYFVDQTNTPFVPVIDSGWDLIGNIPSSSWDTYLSARASQHGNAVFFSMLCSSYIRCTSADSNTAAYDGTKPFTSGTDESNYDLSTPNETYFKEIDSLVRTIASYGMVAIIDPTPSDTTWINTLVNNGATKSYNFGVYLGTRYGSYANVIWQHGNDFQDWNSDPTQNNVMHQVMAGIASVDTNHIQTIELNYNYSYSNRDTLMDDVLEADFCYTYYAPYDCVINAYGSSPTIPVYLGESNYEGENNTGQLPGPATAWDIRLENYWAITSGAAGVQYGDAPVYYFGSGWESHLTDPGAQQLQYILTLAASFPFYNFSYDNLHQVVTAGYGTYDGSNLDIETENYCPTSWDGAIKSVTYCPKAATLTVNMSKFRSNRMRARWFDPTTGTYATIGVFGNSGAESFTSPASHADGNDDWVLVLDPSPTIVNVKLR